MSILILGLGFVLVFEGLVFALAPSRLEDLIAALAQLPIDARRLFGLLAVASGVAILWLARSLGAC